VRPPSARSASAVPQSSHSTRRVESEDRAGSSPRYRRGQASSRESRSVQTASYCNDLGVAAESLSLTGPKEKLVTPSCADPVGGSRTFRSSSLGVACRTTHPQGYLHTVAPLGHTLIVPCARHFALKSRCRNPDISGGPHIHLLRFVNLIKVCDF
jgi:hypothetical protein